jgi:ACS family hexuronate transporter-like MFS transporter
MALGTAVQQIGLFGGGVAAPLLVAAIAPQYGWRAAFALAGALGFIWIPVWWLTSSRIRPIARPTRGDSIPIAALLRDTRMRRIVFCSLTIMMVYSLWLNWTTILFVQQFGLTQADANRYFAWIPPIFATLGGFFGGWMALRRIDGGESPIRARMRVCWLVAPAAAVTAVVPWSESPMLAVSCIAVSFFVCMTLVTNLHVIPIDLFGPERAAFTSSMLTFAFALMQSITAPVFGAVIDRFGFGPLCVVLSVLPFGGLAIARSALTREA